MAHYTYTSDSNPDFAYHQSVQPWHDTTTNTLVVLAVENREYRGNREPAERKSVMLQFDLKGAEALLKELTEAVESQRAHSTTYTFAI